MKKKGSSQFVVQDKWFHEAKKLGYRARSAFKLLEIQEKYALIQPGMKVFDMASAPGSFIQIISKIIGPTGIVLGVDIQKIQPFGNPNVHLLQASVFEKEAIEKFCLDQGILKFDLMTSDIAPSTTGISGVDQYRSIELNNAILDVADIFLRQDGDILLKVFVGEDVDELVGSIKRRYKEIKRMRPKACRERSFEEYFLCRGKKV